MRIILLIIAGILVLYITGCFKKKPKKSGDCGCGCGGSCGVSQPDFNGVMLSIKEGRSGTQTTLYVKDQPKEFAMIKEVNPHMTGARPA